MTQPSLFEDAPWEDDERAEQLIATVVFPGPPEGEFDYLVPDLLRERVGPGRRVRVPLGRGNRALEGYCVRLETRVADRAKLKSVLAALDEQPLLSASMLRLTQWISERYLSSWGQTLEAVIPAGVRGQAGTRWQKLVSVNMPQLALTNLKKLPPKQRQVVQVVLAVPETLTIQELARRAKCTAAPIRALIEQGLLLTVRRRSTVHEQPEPEVARELPRIFNPAQQTAYQAISKSLNSSQYHAHLLYGVTGSGKTEVYLQAIQDVVAFGRQAIVLVPEISLTPQTVSRFRARFDRVAVLHSHLSDSERHYHWNRIAAGEVPVVVGARSAVFAPTPHLGLIVIDEEHETSFKQESAPRYHAREVALERARAEQVPVILGSATPALESWQRALTGEFQLLRLPDRVMDRPLPDVATIDLRLEPQTQKRWGALSRPLRQQMEQVLRGDGQVILLLNRRGFSTQVQCPHCGFVLRCPHCEVALTYHRTDELAICHQCEYHVPAPIRCSECRGDGLRYAGTGTQKLEAEVKAAFSEYPCLRMDTDTMQTPGSHERALDSFRDGEIKILLGTQMIAKGLDFPNVMLVGVVNADLALHLPDFRAGERTFQLLAQVAGRAGRGDRGGRVLVQTLSPEHPAIQFAARHDFEGFANQELPLRLQLGYPPYTSMIRCVARGPQERQTFDFIKELATAIRKAIDADPPTCRVLGPAPAPMTKLRDKFRFHLLLSGPDPAALRAAIREASRELVVPEGVEWISDVDPLGML